MRKTEQKKQWHQGFYGAIELEFREDNMCEALRDLMKEELETERTEGRAEGRAEGRLESIRALMNNLKLSAEQAMESIGIPKSEFNKYMQML